MKMSFFFIALLFICSSIHGQISNKTAEFSKAKNQFPVEKFSFIELCCKTNKYPFQKGTFIEVKNTLQIICDSNSHALSVSDGYVLALVKFNSLNVTVMIDHGTYFSVYQNLINIKVKKGEKIKRGQSIGIVDTHNSLTKLEFEIWKENNQDPEKLNPMNWVEPKSKF